MPTYEYQCSECEIVFELFQPITEPARKRLKKSDQKPCDCNAKVTRLIGIGGGVIFKGSGFYETDYRSESYKSGAKAEKEAKDGKDKKKSDKKTETTKDTKSKPAKSKSAE
jgi:putative FmdB family regulatory protein